MLKSLIKAALAAALIGLASPSLAATLYISEFGNGMSQVGSTSPQVYPQSAITDQTVALSGSSAQSSAFNKSTHAVLLTCDEGCSVTFGATASASPVATTSNFLLQQGVPYQFVVVPGTELAVIANAAGNTGGGGAVTASQGNAGSNAQAWWVRIGDTTNGPVAVKPASTAAVATDSALVVAISPNGQLPAGQAVSASSVPVVIASDQSAVAVKTSDPCTSAAKSSVAISVATATTTSLVAVSGSTVAYVCGFAMTIAPSATAADTALFEYGTSTTCTSPTSLTGTFGNGDLTSAAPVAPVSYGDGLATVFKGAASAGICIVTTGTAVSVQGVLTYVQQ